MPRHGMSITASSPPRADAALAVSVAAERLWVRVNWVAAANLSPVVGPAVADHSVAASTAHPADLGTSLNAVPVVVAVVVVWESVATDSVAAVCCTVCVVASAVAA